MKSPLNGLAAAMMLTGLVAGSPAAGGQPPAQPAFRLWDTGKTYTEKYPCPQAFKDRANWTQVPYGVTDYKPHGDLMLEGETFYLFLFSNKDDSVVLMTKLGTDSFKPNEIYKVHDTGARNFGMGTMEGRVKTLKNTPREIVVEHAGEGQRHGTPQPIVTTYRILAGLPWLEVKPVERVNQQGMHGKSRLCAFAKKEGDDFILDAKRETFRGEANFSAPQGTIGILNFSRKHRTDHDFMWFMTFPPGAEKHPLTYLGFHADPFWEDACSDWPSVGAQYAWLGEGGVFIASLNDPDNWKREDVGRPIQDGETYTTQFKAPYAGKWKMAARLENRFVHSAVEVAVGQPFTFKPPAKLAYGPSQWVLDYILVYLWDRTAQTPASLFTPMDVCRRTVESGARPPNR